jgi:hypothetical protein
MFSSRLPRFAAAAVLLLLLSPFTTVRVARAEQNPAPLLETIDLSPGDDVYNPNWLALNRATHKLYVAASKRLKVVDTATLKAITGVRFEEPSVPANFAGLAVDESPAPAGNKIYLAEKITSTNMSLLRVIDGETNTVIANASDVILPGGDPQINESYTAVAANPANHKVYLATDSGRVVVVDGPNRHVLASLTPNAGSLLVVNPTGNKVFVLGGNGGAIIDGATETVTALALGIVSAKAAVFDPANGRIYLAARLQDRSGIFALDGETGAIVAEKTDLPRVPDALGVAPEKNHVYAGEGTASSTQQIATYDGTNLAFVTSSPIVADKMVYDPAGGGKIFLLQESNSTVQLPDSLGILDPATGALSKMPVGYLPCSIAINNQTNRFYVADQEAPELQVIDGESHQVVARVPANPTIKNSQLLFPRGDIAVSEKLNRFYFPRAWPPGSSTVDVYDGATNQLRSSFLVNQNIKAALGAIEVDDKRGLIYVSATQSAGGSSVRDLIYVFDAGSEMLKTTITLGLSFASRPEIPYMAVNPSNGDIYFLLQTGLVQIIDGTTHNQTSIAFEGRVTAVAVNSQSNKIFVALDPDNDPISRIAVIKGATRSVEATFAAPQFNSEKINALAVDPDRNILYAGDSTLGQDDGPGKIAAYDAGDNYRYIGGLDAGQIWSFAFNSAAHELVAANSEDGTIQIMRPERWKLFGNISTRGRVGPGADNVLIGGFIVAGPPDSKKKVMVRAIGPSLSQNGVANPLPDPIIELHDSLGNVIRNDDWKLNESTNSSQEADIVATGLAPRNGAESAVIAELPPGPCTAVVRGKNGDAGVALVEVYGIDLEPNGRLANISTRGSVGNGDNAMIGGLIVQGLQPSRVVIRALGPTLAAFGVANTLEDPTLELRDSNGSLVEFNDDWKRDEVTGTSQEAEIVATSIAPTDDRESAIVVTLQPGQYTAVVRGKADTIGVALVEAYNVE